MNPKLFIVYKCDFGSKPRVISYFSNFEAAKRAMEERANFEQELRMSFKEIEADMNIVTNFSMNMEFHDVLTAMSVGNHLIDTTLFYIKSKTIYNEPPIF